MQPGPVRQSVRRIQLRADVHETSSFLPGLADAGEPDPREAFV
jgi:hypothetical protein